MRSGSGASRGIARARWSRPTRPVGTPRFATAARRARAAERPSPPGARGLRPQDDRVFAIWRARNARSSATRTPPPFPGSGVGASYRSRAGSGRRRCAKARGRASAPPPVGVVPDVEDAGGPVVMELPGADGGIRPVVQPLAVPEEVVRVVTSRVRPPAPAVELARLGDPRAPPPGPVPVQPVTDRLPDRIETRSPPGPRPPERTWPRVKTSGAAIRCTPAASRTRAPLGALATPATASFPGRIVASTEGAPLPPWPEAPPGESTSTTRAARSGIRPRPVTALAYPRCVRRNASVRSRARRALGAWWLPRSSQLKPWPAG